MPTSKAQLRARPLLRSRSSPPAAPPASQRGAQAATSDPASSTAYKQGVQGVFFSAPGLEPSDGPLKKNDPSNKAVPSPITLLCSLSVAEEPDWLLFKALRSMSGSSKRKRSPRLERLTGIRSQTPRSRYLGISPQKPPLAARLGIGHSSGGIAVAQAARRSPAARVLATFVPPTEVPRGLDPSFPLSSR